MAFDLDGFLAMTRLSGLLVAPDGRLVVHSAAPDADGATFLTGLLEIDPADGGARQLTVPRAGMVAVGWTPGGELLFRDARPDPALPASDPAAGDATAALWTLPAGGEARFLAGTPSGVAAVRVATDTGTIALVSDVFPSAGTLAEDRAKAEARAKADTSALLLEGYPFRDMDRHLGPRAPRMFVVRADGGLRDLTGDVGHALRGADWDITPDGRGIVTTWETPTGRAEVDRYLVTIDVRTGERRTLFRDRRFLIRQVTCSPDGRFAAVTRIRLRTPETPQDSHLVLVPLDGSPPRRLAESLDLFPKNPVWLPDSRAVLFTADQRGRAPLFRIDIADPDAEAVRLSHEGAFSDPRPTPDGRTVYALRSTMVRPPEVVALHPTRPDQRPSVVYATEPPEPLSDRAEEVRATAEDGTVVRGWLMLPRQASATRPAPLLVMLHGGPVQSWNAWEWGWQPQVFTARGYAVLLPDPAFSTGYGIQMLRRGWAHWAATAYADVLALTDAALRRDDLDAERTAVSGGSYGGYLTNWIIGHTNRFRCAVTHAGPWDLPSFRGTTDNLMYWERWWGELAESREHYLEMSPSSYLDRISTPTLVLHGERDYRVAIGQGLALYTGLRRRGVPAALVYLPEETHFVVKPGDIRVWYGAFLAWLDRHVLGKPWNPPEIL